MQSYWTYIATDIAAERTREADRHRLAALARGDGPDRSIRHRVAVAAATISRLSAGLVRRLDECVADDLATSFGAPSPSAH